MRGIISEAPRLFMREEWGESKEVGEASERGWVLGWCAGRVWLWRWCVDDEGCRWLRWCEWW